MDVDVGISAAEAELPAIHERRCPTCQSEQKLTKSTQRCEACGTAFVFVRKAII
jgi:hypothetical protein